MRVFKQIQSCSPHTYFREAPSPDWVQADAADCRAVPAEVSAGPALPYGKRNAKLAAGVTLEGGSSQVDQTHWLSRAYLRCLECPVPAGTRGRWLWRNDGAGADSSGNLLGELVEGNASKTRFPRPPPLTSDSSRRRRRSWMEAKKANMHVKSCRRLSRLVPGLRSPR